MNEKVPTSETLLQHSGWLRALALRLVQDASRADDVVQQAFLQAIRKPPREAKALPAWLARVARNEARQIGRSETARVRREIVTRACLGPREIRARFTYSRYAMLTWSVFYSLSLYDISIF